MDPPSRHADPHSRHQRLGFPRRPDLGGWWRHRNRRRPRQPSQPGLPADSELRVRPAITITTIPIACAVLLSCGGEPTTPPVTPPAQQEIPISGDAVPGMGSYDQIVPDLMRKYAIPGGALAVLRDGK